MLGACIGDCIAGKYLGKRAMFIGAIAQSIPDIDFINSIWNNTAASLLAHRGFTHSIVFGFLSTVFLALLAEHSHKKHKIGYSLWLFFFGIELGVHLFLDLFNSYGIGLLEPFNHIRLSLNSIFVADPFFSIGPFIAFCILLVLKTKDRRRKFWQKLAVISSSLYLSYCVYNKITVYTAINKSLQTQQISSKRFLFTPTPFNNWLWYIAVENDSGFLIGFKSVFHRNKNIDWRYFPRNDSLLRTVANHEELQQLLRFSQGYYTVEKWKDTLVFNDLRFGQISGWENSRNHFVFHYFLMDSLDANKLVIQRGRFSGWNKRTVSSLIHAILK